MEAGISLVVVIVFAILAIIAFSNKEKGNNAHQYSDSATKAANRPTKQDAWAKSYVQSFKTEYSSHERIFKDSMKLIETTNNIDTLLGRHNDASEEWSWMEMQKAKGMPVIIKQEPCGFYSTLNRITNFNIIRIAKFNYNKLQSDIINLKSKKAVENRIVKLIELLDKCTCSLKFHDNLERSKAELLSIRSKLEELLYK
jgi:hypothetical protein